MENVETEKIEDWDSRIGKNGNIIYSFRSYTINQVLKLVKDFDLQHRDLMKAVGYIEKNGSQTEKEYLITEMKKIGFEF